MRRLQRFLQISVLLLLRRIGRSDFRSFRACSDHPALLACFAGIAVFSSCTLLGLSKPRGYPENRKGSAESGSQHTDTAPSADADLLLPRLEFALANDQIAHVIESAFEVQTLTREILVLPRAPRSDLAGPRLSGALEENLWQTLVSSASEWAARLVETSPLIERHLATCRGNVLSVCLSELDNLLGQRLTSWRSDGSRLFVVSEEDADDVMNTDGSLSVRQREALNLLVAKWLASPLLWFELRPEYSPPETALSSGPASQESSGSKMGLDPQSLSAWTLAFWRELPVEAPQLEQVVAHRERERQSTFERGSSTGSIAHLLPKIVEDDRFRQAWFAFVTKWLNLDLVEGIKKSTEVHPGWSEDLQAAFAEELMINAQRVFDSGLGIDSMIYDEGWQVPEKVTSVFPRLGKGLSQRVGYLTTGAFASLTSGELLTKPTARGHFVLSRLLCREVPSPPEGVGAISADLNNIDISPRQKFERHTLNPACSSCHLQMDPIGYVLESLDPLGLYRTDYSALTRLGLHFGSSPIDTTVVLPIDEAKIAVSTSQDLSRVIASSKAFRTCAVRSFTEFLLNRTRDELAAEAVLAVEQTIGDQPISPRNVARAIVTLNTIGEVSAEGKKKREDDPQ